QAVNHIDSYHVTYTKFCTLPELDHLSAPIVNNTFKSVQYWYSNLTKSRDAFLAEVFHFF
ncbi:MAG: hypothetical protein PHV14_10620, partial [Bacteroidales bacterium]|nr:hypothetical protein [Bacteroidales bacterium]